MSGHTDPLTQLDDMPWARKTPQRHHGWDDMARGGCGVLIAHPEPDERQHAGAPPPSPAVGLADHALHPAFQERCDSFRILARQLHLILESYLRTPERAAGSDIVDNLNSLTYSDRTTWTVLCCTRLCSSAVLHKLLNSLLCPSPALKQSKRDASA